MIRVFIAGALAMAVATPAMAQQSQQIKIPTVEIEATATGKWVLKPELCPDIREDVQDAQSNSSQEDRREDRIDQRIIDCPQSAYVFEANPGQAPSQPILVKRGGTAEFITRERADQILARAAQQRGRRVGQQQNQVSALPQARFSIAANSVPCRSGSTGRCLMINDKFFGQPIEGYLHNEGIPAQICVERALKPGVSGSLLADYVYRRVACAAAQTAAPTYSQPLNNQGGVTFQAPTYQAPVTTAPAATTTAPSTGGQWVYENGGWVYR